MVSNDQSETAHSANGMIMNNNVAYSAKQAGGPTVDILKKNASDQTLIGENSVRATRFVAITPTEVLNTNPGDTNFTDLDVTAQTSARAFAIVGSINVNAATAQRIGYARKNGTALAKGPLTTIIRAPTTSNFMTDFYVELDTGQVFEWAVDNTDVSALIIHVKGYWEYVD